MNKFNVGDFAWIAHTKAVELHQTCPDCQGQRALTVILGDGSQVSVECEGCKRGYEGPRGYVNYHGHETVAERTLIEGLEIRSPEEIRYYTAHGIFDEKQVFASEEEAKVKAEELAAERNRVELDRINHKEKPASSWAWNVTYHRREVKRAERELEYHKAKLAVAKVKAKENEG